MAQAPSDATTMRLASPSGIEVELNANGSSRRFDCGAIALGLFPGNELEGGPANLYLRHHAERIEWTPLLGPRSPTRFRVDPNGALVGAGVWHGIRYSLALVLARATPAWFWHVHLENTGASVLKVDLTYVQDLALAPYGAVRLNEYYVSQYLDHTPLVDPGLSQLISGIRRSRQPLTPGPTRSGRSSAAGLLADDGAWEQDLEEVLAARRSDGYREDVE